MTARRPTLLLLTGPSSSGKTSIAHQLQKKLRHQFWRVSMDDFVNMGPGKKLTLARLRNASRLTIQSVHTLLIDGNNVMLDAVMAPDLVSSFKEQASAQSDVITVLINAAPDVLKRREALRENRQASWLAQSASFNNMQNADIRLDTTVGSPEENAARLENLLKYRI